MRLRRWLWIALVLPLPASSQMVSEVDTTGRERLPTAARTEIPFKLYQDYLVVVQGSVGTLERLNLLIDTGSNVTSVDRKIALKLGLKGQSYKLALLNRTATVESVVLPSLQIGPIRAESLPGIVQDLSFVDTIVGLRIDAVVGLDFLAQSSFTINYESKKMVFGPIEVSSLMVPFKIGAPMVTVELRLDGQPVRLLVDTGSRDLLLFERQLPPGLRNLPTHDVSQSFNSGATSFERKEILLSRVQLGATDRCLKKAFLTNGSVSSDQSFDGALGPAGLGLKWIAFDFESGSFGWKW